MCVSLSLFSVFFGLPNNFTQMPRIVRQSFPRIIIEPSPSSSPLQTKSEPRAQSDYAPLASALFCSFASRILQETLTHLGRVCWYPNLAQAIAATSKFRFQMDRAADKKKPNGKQNQQDYCNFLSARVARLWLWPFLCEANCHKLSSLRLQTRETCRVL